MTTSSPGKDRVRNGLRDALKAVGAALVPFALLTAPAFAQKRSPPQVRLTPAVEIDLPGTVDSNSPAVWSADGSQLHVFTSVNGAVQQASGPTISELGSPTPVVWLAPPAGGAWMEAVVRDHDVLYGYYHNEVVSPDCGNNGKARPRIGAARSMDNGMTWEDLGVILESSEPSVCETTNLYDDGGVGDFSVMLDAPQNYVYVLYSAYGASLDEQGVSIARMPWAERDEPVGAMAVWQSGLWLPASMVSSPDGGSSAWVYPTGTPIYRARRSWHSADGLTDAFWGPSIHWNTYLRRYVMFLNHADSVDFHQEGIYVAFAAALDNPDGWSIPQRVMAGGRWYPQVLGLNPEAGTDKEAGQEARFYMSGHSSSVIRFDRPTGRAPCMLACTSPDGR